MAGKFIVALCLVFIPLTGHADNRNVIRQSDGSITFVVDEGLEPIEEKYRYLSDGEKMAKAILSKDKTILNGAYNIVASSFEGAKNLRGAEKDAFFQCVLRAYKKHQSVTLSPDMICVRTTGISAKGLAYCRHLKIYLEKNSDKGV